MTLRKFYTFVGSLELSWLPKWSQITVRFFTQRTMCEFGSFNLARICIIWAKSSVHKADNLGHPPVTSLEMNDAFRELARSDLNKTDGLVPAT